MKIFTSIIFFAGCFLSVQTKAQFKTNAQKIGLFPKTNGTAFYLYDGGARSIEEAILWHGGDAQKAKEQVINLIKTDRDKLLKFLNSL